MYVDDMLIIGKRTDTRVYHQNSEMFCEDSTQLADYLGCEFHMNKLKTRGLLGQPSIIKSFRETIW